MVFSGEQKEKANSIQQSVHAKMSSLASHEVKDLAVVWCYYSGKIEGNTYSYVETEALLKDGITSEHAYKDARELKNLYNTFIHVTESIQKGKNDIPYDKRTVCTIHSMLTDELLPDADRGQFRASPVKITGTEYTPPVSETEIERMFACIMDEQEKYTDPLEKAVFLHCNIARLQPFRDGNKRTSRMMESIVLMNNDIIPVYSSKDSDILAYRKSLIHFYETKDYSEYAKYFLNRQKERINELDKKAPLPESIKLQTSQKSSKTKCLISTSRNKVQTNKIKKI